MQNKEIQNLNTSDLKDENYRLAHGTMFNDDGFVNSNPPSPSDKEEHGK